MSSTVTETYPVGAGALAQFACVKTPAALVVSAADTDVIVGFVQESCAANQPRANVALSGPSKAIASGPITKGVRICPDAAGKIKAAVSGDLVCGEARQAAGADGDIIDILVYKTTVVLA